MGFSFGGASRFIERRAAGVKRRRPEMLRVPLRCPGVDTGSVRLHCRQKLGRCGKALAQIRMLVGINTLIGLLTIAVGAGGRYFVP